MASLYCMIRITDRPFYTQITVLQLLYMCEQVCGKLRKHISKDRATEFEIVAVILIVWVPVSR